MKPLTRRSTFGIASLALATLLLGGVTAWAQLPAKGDLTIHVTGFTHDRGQAIASLFQEGDDVFGKPRMRVRGVVHQQQATLVFPAVPAGRYAVMVFHDENGNNDLDHNVFRFPAEPLGYSNGFELTLFSGLPTSQKLGFSYAGDDQPLELHVK